jgi:hypothetical protein
MQRYFARVVRAIIVSVLGFGGGIGLMTFIAAIVLTGKQQGAIMIGLIAAAGVGSVFAIIFAFVLLLSDLTPRVFRSGSKIRRDEIWELEQTREYMVHGTARDAKRFCREALLAVPNVNSILEPEDSEDVIRASIGRSWRSAGENMECQIVPRDQEYSLITCSSRCITPEVQFDYAKNFENVEAWLRMMNRLAEGKKKVRAE